MADVITLDGPTRQLPTLPTWGNQPPRLSTRDCRSRTAGSATLTGPEAELIVELAGGRRGEWRAERCEPCGGFHMARRTHHERRPGRARKALAYSRISALIAVAALGAVAIACGAIGIAWVLYG